MLIEGYFRVFTHPLFWVMVVIAVGIIYIGYRFYVVGDADMSEEEIAVSNQLEVHDLVYVTSEQTKAITRKNGSVFTYRIVKAQNKEQQEITLEAVIEYQGQRLVKVVFDK